MSSVINNQIHGQTIQAYKDFYENGKPYCKGYQVKINGSCCYDIDLWTYWYEDGNKISEELRDTNALTKYINCWDGR
jgi:hypothetical protein